MSGPQWLALGGFVAVVAALFLAVAELEAGVAVALVAAFGAYSAMVLRNADRVPARVSRRTPLRPGRDADPRRTSRDAGRR